MLVQNQTEFKANKLNLNFYQNGLWLFLKQAKVAYNENYGVNVLCTCLNPVFEKINTKKIFCFRLLKLWIFLEKS